ncbi:unnamed protein product, partial [Brenthis ino]
MFSQIPHLIESDVPPSLGSDHNGDYRHIVNSNSWLCLGFYYKMLSVPAPARPRAAPVTEPRQLTPVSGLLLGGPLHGR